MSLPQPKEFDTPQSDRFAVILSGRIVDDLYGSPVTDAILYWAVVDDAGLLTYGPFFADLDGNGRYVVELETFNAAGAFTPYLAGYTIVLGGGNVSTSAHSSGPVPRATQDMRALISPSAVRPSNKDPLIEASGSIEGRHSAGQWTNSPTLTVQPNFASGSYDASALGIDEPGQEITGGRGAHIRYLWGVTDWTSADVEASGLPYLYSSGVLSLPLEIYNVADSDRTTEVFPSGTRYFNLEVSVSGVNGSAFSNLVRYPVPFDSGDPPFPDILSASGTATTLDVALSGVVDDQTDLDVTYRVSNTTSGLTSTFASGITYQESGLTENTSYTIVAAAKDAAGNISVNGPSTIVTVLVVDPAEGDLTFQPGRDGVRGDLARLTAASFTNASTGSSGYRFRRWNGTETDVTVTPRADSGWSTVSTWDDLELVPGQTYTWGLTYRNQFGVETATRLLTRTFAPLLTPDPPPPPPPGTVPAFVLSKTESPAIRWAARIESVDLQHVTYAEESALVSQPFTIPEPIYQVRLVTEEVIPADYPAGNWIRYVVLLGDEQRVVPIVPGDRTTGPRVIAVNSFLDPQERLLAETVGWSFVDMAAPVRTIRLRATLTRPPDRPTSTPLLLWYDLIVTGRQALYRSPLERGISPQPR